MTGPIVVAQASNPQGPGGASPRIITVNKPQGQQAITIHLDGSVKLDLSAIANEKITLVHLGNRLIILFDNHATVTFEPFYGDNGQPLPDVTVELGPGRDISGADFAGLFPVTTDPAVLPASGGPGSVSSGAYFASFSIDALAGAGPGLPLLGPSEFGRPDFSQSQEVPRGGIGESLTRAGIGAATDEGGLITDSIGTTGNDRGFAFSVTGAPGSLAALVDFGTGGPNAIPFQFAPTASAWLAGLGLSSHGSPIDSATVAGQTLTGLAHDGHAVFTLTLNTDSSWKFTLLAPLDHAQGIGETSVTIDLSGMVQAVDAAGLTLTLVDDFKIGVVDDMPVAALGVTVSGTVATAGLIFQTPPVFLAESFGGSNANLGPQGGAGSAQAGGPAGQLETLVHFGADGENPVPFRFVSNAIDVLTGLNLVAAGEQVNFATVTTTASGTTLAAFTEGSSAGIEAFTLTLGNDGSWAFTMLAPLTHKTIDLSGLVQAVDFDGSIIGLAANALTVKVTGDVPTLIPGADGLAGTANEGGLVGTADGGTDPFGTGNEPTLSTQTGGPTFDPNPPFEISGSLNSLVNFGGDGRDTMPFQFTIGDKAQIDLGNPTSGALDLGLTSHGVAIDFATISGFVTGETLTAYAGGSAGGTPVFTLTINGDGSWTFTLLAPIDHNANAPLTLDLSSLVKGVDSDGDFVVLAPHELQVTVTDDAPVLATPSDSPTFKFLSGVVNEGGLTLATDPYGDGNHPGPTLASGTPGDLDGLVHFGADGPNPMPFQFVANIDAALADINMFSHGASVNFADVVTTGTGTTLTAHTGGSAASPAVFTLTLNDDGSWAFQLLAPIDHGAPDRTFDLSGLVQAVDFDGSTVTLGGSDLKVTITNDTPVLTGQIDITHGVDEGALVASATGGDLYGGGNDPGSPAVSGSLATLVALGADGPALDGDGNAGFQFAVADGTTHDFLVKSHGVEVNFVTLTASADVSGVETQTLTAWTTGGPATGHEVFTLTLNGDGTYTFTLINPIDDATGLGENSATLDLSTLIQAMDFDGDTVPLAAGDFKITVTDDVPVLSTAPAVTATLDEGGLTSPPNAHGIGNDPTAVTSASGLAGSLTSLVNFGADGPGPFPLTGGNGFRINFDVVHDHDFLVAQGLSSNGAALSAVTLSFPAAGVSQLNVFDTNGHEMFNLVVNSDGSWTFKLLESLDHPTGDGENSTTIDLSGLIQAIDFDGDIVNLANDFKITVTDDVPTAGAVTATMTNNAEGTVTLVDGVDFSSGADGLGSLVLDTDHATITGPPGVTVGIPTFIPCDTLDIEPGTAFLGLAVGQTATIDIPYTVTDFDGDSATNHNVVTVNGVDQSGLYFSGQDPELIRLDTEGNLSSVAVNPANPNGSNAGEDGGFIQFANQLYFFAFRDGVGDVLFSLNGANDATPVLDANGDTIGDAAGVDANYTIYDGNLYFIGQGSGTGLDLFRIDAAGAVHAIDVNPGTANAFDQFNNFGLTQFDGNLYFTAYNASNDTYDQTGLFFIDPSGALHQVEYYGHSLADAGEDGGFFSFNGGLFFNVFVPGLGDALFVLDANGQPTPVIPHIFGETTYFQTLGGSLYVTEATPGGTPDGLVQIDTCGCVFEVTYGYDSFDFTVASQQSLGGLAAFNGSLFFSANTDTTDYQPGVSFNPVLFEVDACGCVSEVLFNDAPLTFAGEAGGFAAFNGHLYFFAADAAHPFGALFELDASNTVTLVSDPTSLGNSFGPPETAATGQPAPDAHFTQFDGNLYFEAQTGLGVELVQIDASGTVHVIDVNPNVGPPTGDGFPGEPGGFGVYTPMLSVFGTAGNDHLSGNPNTVFIGGKGDDSIHGAGSHDTAVINANFADPSTHITLSGGTITVTSADGIDTLTGIDRVQFADHGLLIVDPAGNYGFSSVQAAVDAATAGDTIWVLPGTYTESTIPTGVSSTPGGLYINTPNLTLQGVEANGALITTAAAAQADGAVIISGHQTDFGSNHFIGRNGDNTVIQGLHLQAGAETNNKLLEIWANN